MPLPKSLQYNAMADVIARHMIALGRKPDCTFEDILDVAPSHGKLVTWYFNALAYLNELNHFMSYEDMTEKADRTNLAYVREGNMKHQYRFYNGAWNRISTGYDSDYYG